MPFGNSAGHCGYSFLAYLPCRIIQLLRSGAYHYIGKEEKRIPHNGFAGAEYSFSCLRIRKFRYSGDNRRRRIFQEA